MKSFDKLITIIQAAQIEVEKHDKAGGNKAAGTRLRGLMQDVKATAGDVRTEVLVGRG